MRIYHLICILIILLCIWLLRFWSGLNQEDKLIDGSIIHIKGIVTSQPYQYKSKQIIEIGTFSILTNPLPRYFYGQEIEVIGTLRKEVTAFGKTNKMLMYPNIHVIEPEKSTSGFDAIFLQSRLYRMREDITENFSNFLIEPQASLLSGVVLGVKSRISPRFIEALRRTGTIHVVVASGYNVTVVAGVLSAIFLRFLSRRLAIPVIVVGIILYAMMAGAEPPIVRASIMGSLAFVAQFLGQQYLAFWGLLLASLVMLVIDPFTIFDAGFQLSVAATAGILLLSPLILNGFRYVRWFRFGLAEHLAVTLGAQLAVLPVLLVCFRQVSWLSPVVNLLVIPLIPVIMALGGGVAVMGLISRDLAQLIAFFSWVPLTLFVEVVYWFDRLPWGVFQIASVSWWWVVGYYLVFAGWIWHSLRRRNKKWVNKDSSVS